MRKTLEFGELIIEIDGWGGVHIDWSDSDDMDENVALSPLVMEEIDNARRDVLEETNDDSTQTTETDD